MQFYKSQVVMSVVDITDWLQTWTLTKICIEINIGDDVKMNVFLVRE